MSKPTVNVLLMLGDHLVARHRELREELDRLAEREIKVREELSRLEKHAAIEGISLEEDTPRPTPEA